MRFIQLTDENGVETWINPLLILALKPRPKTELGTIVRFQNGNAINVVEGVYSVLGQIAGKPPIIGVTNAF